MLDTNPVVVRRTMALLKKHSHVQSEKGHGGGWRLARPLKDITLLDIHRALGSGSVFCLGLANEHPQCLVEQAVNEALSQALAAAEAFLLEQMGDINLAQV